MQSVLCINTSQYWRRQGQLGFESEVSIAAVDMGASVIEKHFTLNRNLPGLDHQASHEPEELAAMDSAIRNIEIALGDGIKRLTPSPVRNVPVMRKTLLASQTI